MSCPTPDLLAAVASGHDDRDVLVHAEDCVVCGHELAEQRELRAMLAGVPAPILGRARRDALAAEVMARADALPNRRYQRWFAPGIAAAAAALLAYAAAEPIELYTVSAPEPIAAVPPAVRPAIARANPPPVAPSPAPVVDPPPPPKPARVAVRPATIAGDHAQFTRAHANGRDVVDLSDGEITIDTRSAAPVDVPLGNGAKLRVAQAKVTVRAQRGVVQSVTVFAGSAEVTASGRQQRVEAGEIWHRDTLAETEPTPAPPSNGVEARGAAAAFREGWEALRAARYSDAIAAFDRASDPVVAEDAAYWAAIAAERAGDREAAVRRLTAFLAAFPGSPRAEPARAALAKLGR